MDIVRNQEEAATLELPPLLVLDPLEQFLDSVELGRGQVLVERIGEGHSNVTFMVRRGEHQWVLRRPPRPPFHPSAHDVMREYRLLKALENSDVPIARPICASEDETIMGVPFYVMEAVDGYVFQSSLPDEFSEPSECRRISEELVDALVAVHAAPWRELGLEDFGSADGYLERQLHRFGGLWAKNKTREIPELDQVTEWLAANRPQSGTATIAHGDFRLGNVMFAPKPPAKLVAVFDWELATIGDPLADVGYLAATWAQEGDPDSVFTLGAVTTRPGFMTREELVARYCERSGRSADQLAWYQALALWRAAIFLEGNYKRLLAGTTDDPWYRLLDSGVPELANRALSLTV